MEQLKQFYTKYKPLLWPVTTTLSSVVILALVIIPQILNFFEVRSKIFDVQNQAYSLNVKAARLQTIDETNIQQKLQVVFTLLPTDRDVPLAAATLQDLVNKSGLVLKDVSFRDSPQSSNKNSFQLNITVSGQTESLKIFLASLSNSSRIFQMESISSRYTKGGSTIEADIPLLVFFEPAPPSIGSVSQSVPRLEDQEEQLISRLQEVVVRNVGSLTGASESATPLVPLGKSNPFE